MSFKHWSVSSILTSRAMEVHCTVARKSDASPVGCRICQLNQWQLRPCIGTLAHSGHICSASPPPPSFVQATPMSKQHLVLVLSSCGFWQCILQFVLQCAMCAV